MKNYFSTAIILLILITFGCQVSTPDLSNATNDPRFRVAEPNRLFFKNIRQIDYRQSQGDHSQLEIYVHADWPQPTGWQIAIDHYWLVDEAYLRFVPPAQLADSTQWLMSIPGEGSAPRLLRLDLRLPASQYEAGQQLLQCLRTQKTITITTAEGQHRYELFDDEADQKSAMITLHDYFELVSKR